MASSHQSDWTEDDIGDQTGRTILITGANSGIGYQAARALAQHGAHVVLGCRTRSKADEAVARIDASNPSGSTEVLEMETAQGFEMQFGVASTRQDPFRRHQQPEKALTVARLLPEQRRAQFDDAVDPSGVRPVRQPESGDGRSPDAARRSRPVGPVKVDSSSRSKDDAAALQLWEISERSTAVIYPI